MALELSKDAREVKFDLTFVVADRWIRFDETKPIFPEITDIPGELGYFGTDRIKLIWGIKHPVI